MKNLLFVGGARPVPISTVMAEQALAQARSRGIRTHVVNRPDALAGTPTVSAAADAVSAVDFVPSEQTVAWARSRARDGERFDAVFALQEMAQVAVAEVARALGAPGNEPEAVRRIRTKDLCRAALAEAGFAQPAVRLCADVRAAADFLEELSKSSKPGPWVVKPRDAMGSIGVSLVRGIADLPGAVAALPDESPFLIEEFVEGPEFSVEGVFLGGEPRILAVTAKEKAPPPFFVEVGHVLPAEISETEHDRIRDRVAAALSTLGLRTGAFHVELWLTADGPVLGEVHGRFGGDWIHTMLQHAIPDLEVFGLVFEDMLGLPGTHTSLEPTRGAAVRYLVPPPGQVTAIEGWEEVLAHPAVLHAQLLVAPGDIIKPLRQSSDRAGFVVVGADDPALARKLATELVDSVRFTVQDAPADRLPGLWSLT
ncbi:protein of unknown function DUF201 [Catenulispora acidiphila DSM 44928]|uniref:ATP-grasp domain-containing protein n=1 Tax=Catenulispora acidiphila (strain DSM 44928 / JCM 14897 / NBRC 102108 / NRRL B-24433 / ID139908) TaxID=479433 RepID=C7QD68_CATAD|nr:ATP-grasp domain-containing protein [Catenulispora acidiphila]ACU72661.1 protein of unknown function DUF201 [Catenulispora acidiphila DSM 44928]